MTRDDSRDAAARGDDERDEHVDDVGYTVYLALCRDGSLYTGIARDLWSRIALHDEGRGARYTRGRGPLDVRFIATSLSKREALALEARIKRLSTVTKRKVAHLD